MPSRSHSYRKRDFEALEARLLLSFTEVSAGDLGLLFNSSGPFWIDFDNDGWIDLAERIAIKHTLMLIPVKA